MYDKNEKLEQRVEQYREQMELQRDSYSSQQNESSNFRETLRKKDKEMNAVLDQIEVSVLHISSNNTRLSSCLVGGREGEESLGESVTAGH